MSSKAKKLGTLADIFQAEKLDGTILKIPVHKIKPSEIQPRQNRTLKIEDLSKSISQDGLLSPILVTKENDYYRIIAGERRYHAVISLGWKEIECKIISRETKDYFRISLIENLQREDLTPEEEAQAMLFLKKQENLTDSELANLLGKSRNYISEILSINELPKEAIQRCKDLGFLNKNFLIQVAQAFKKGNLDSFLNALEEGTIKTVKDAKKFNKIPVKAHFREKPKKENEKQPYYEIHLEENKILIITEDKVLAKKIHHWIKENIETLLK
ncbi:MAG: ParB/RepB/Spo0J family partition protein [Leptonema sp. (in: bacteria)]